MTRQLHQRIAEAYVREYGLSCTWEEFHTYARKSGLSGPLAAKKMKREGLA